MFVRWSCALFGLALALSAGDASSADDYLGSIEILSRSIAEYRAVDAQEARELAFSFRDLRAEIARPRFMSPEALRQIGRQIRAKASADDPAIANLLSSIEDVTRWIDLGTPQNWAQYCRNRAEKIAAIAPADMAAQRRSLSAQLAGVESFLSTALPAARRDWENYLFWNETNRFASTDKPSADQLDRLETRWANSVLALDNSSLAAASIAVQRFVHLQRRAQSERTPNDWARLLREMANILDRQPNDNSPDRRLLQIAIELERYGVACELGNVLRRRDSHPNATFIVSTKNLIKKASVPLDEDFQVNDVFGGVFSRGQGRLTGMFGCDPLPSPSVARWAWLIDAVSRSRSTGSSQGVSVTSLGITNVHGSKVFEWGPAGLFAYPAEADASADVNYENIDSGGGRLRHNAASSRAYANLPQAERDAAAATENSTKERLDAEASRLLGKAVAVYDREFRMPAALSLNAVNTVTTRSTETEFSWLCRYEPLGSLAAPAAPPDYRSNADVHINLHESFVSGMLSDRLRGKKMTGKEFADLFAGFVGSRVAASSQSDDWRVRWAKNSPATCKFSAGSLRWELRTEKFTTSDGEYPGFLLQVAYHPKQHGKQAFALVREANVVVLPHDYDPQGKAKLSGRQVLLRRAASRRLQTVLAPEIPLKDGEVPFMTGQVAKARLVQLDCQSGWLSASLDFEKSSAAAANDATAPSSR
jgi:hypothetical protein